MSTYKKNKSDVDVGGFSNCPPFLERYLTFRQTFTNTKSGSLVDIFTVLREFCQYVHFKNRMFCEPSTKDAHKDMDISLMDVQEVCDLSQEDLERYLCFLEAKVRNSSKTICKKLNFLKKFYLYLERNEEELGITLPHKNPARFLDLPQTVVENPVTLTQSEIEKLVNGTTGENTLRDAAIIMVLATTGIQTSELINLDRCDLEGDTLQIRSHKGTRAVALTDACSKMLRKYLRSTDEFNDPDCPLFLAAVTGRRLTARAIQLRIEKAAGVAGLGDRNITARTLRNTAAAMLSKSYSPDEVRKYMGCKSRVAMRGLLHKNEISQDILKDTQIAQIGEKRRIST